MFRGNGAYKVTSLILDITLLLMQPSQHLRSLSLTVQGFNRGRATRRSDHGCQEHIRRGVYQRLDWCLPGSSNYFPLKHVASCVLIFLGKYVGCGSGQT